MVPFRFIATCFGAEVDWDGNAGSVIIIYNGKNIRLPIGMSYAFVNGVQTPINAPAEIIAGRTFVPFRAVSELLGDVYLEYDNATSTIIAAKAPITGAYNVAYYVNLFNTIVK